jgi:hypothetical protein
MSGRRRSALVVIAALVAAFGIWSVKSRIAARTRPAPEIFPARDVRRIQALRPPRFARPTDDATAARVRAPVGLAVASATDAALTRRTARDGGGFTYAASLVAVRESVKAVGGDLFRTILLEDRGFYLSYAGGIRECGEDFIRRSSEFVNWLPNGSVALDVEVADSRLTIVRAVRLHDEERFTQPDDKFWECYQGAVTKLAFRCNGCKPGKHRIFWQLKPVLLERGRAPVPEARLPDPEGDPVLLIDR